LLLLDSQLRQDPLLAEGLLPEGNERLETVRQCHIKAHVLALLALELGDEQVDKAIMVWLAEITSTWSSGLSFPRLLVRLANTRSTRS